MCTGEEYKGAGFIVIKLWDVNTAGWAGLLKYSLPFDVEAKLNCLHVKQKFCKNFHDLSARNNARTLMQSFSKLEFKGRFQVGIIVLSASALLQGEYLGPLDLKVYPKKGFPKPTEFCCHQEMCLYANMGCWSSPTLVFLVWRQNRTCLSTPNGPWVDWYYHSLLVSRLGNLSKI